MATKVRIRFGGRVNERTGNLVYKAQIGTSTYHSPNIDRIREQVLQHKDYDNSGAAGWYGQGRYMGD